jgi:hypothetical protein
MESSVSLPYPQRMIHMTIDELEAKLDAKTPEAQAIWMTLARNAQMYSTPLFALSKTPQGDVLELAGSGTFLAKEDDHYILRVGTKC